MKKQNLIISLLFLFLTAGQSVAQGGSDAEIVKSILTNNGLSADNISPYVTTNSSGRVVSLDLSGLGLTELAEQIGELTYLTALDLSQNNLSTLPDHITNLPLMTEYQEVEYGCQIFMDGQCIRWGDVLVTKTDTLKADFSGNLLCSLEGLTATWANYADPDWRQDQYLDENKNARCDGTGIKNLGAERNARPFQITLQPQGQSVKLTFPHILLNARVLIFDFTGKEITGWTGVSSNAVVWDRENVPAGVYRIHIKDHSKIYSGSFHL